MKCNSENYQKLKICMYELTGMQYYLLPNDFNGTNFFSEFHKIVKEIKELIKLGNLPTFPLYNVGTKSNAPYTCASLIFWMIQTPAQFWAKN